MFIVSGQVKRETLNANNSKLRQLGDQENNITYMVKKITKFSYILKNSDFVDDISRDVSLLRSEISVLKVEKVIEDKSSISIEVASRSSDISRDN